MKLINYLQFDYLTKSSKPKIILVKNKDEKFNRNAIDRLEELAKENPNVEFFHMYDTEKNIEFLNKKFNQGELAEIKNYPQLLILKDNKLSVFPDKIFLKYSLSHQELNKELSKNLI
jgi:thiol-disulfide isomerase/thioredoxin